jgi:ferric-chelate reductase
VEQLGIYGWFVLPTGALAGIVLIPIMLVSALPIVRRRIYNTFYCIHVIFALLITVALCLHASTNFYFILPGLLLWLYDWFLRMQNASFYKQTIYVESAGGDWYRMRFPNVSDTVSIDVSTAEKGLTLTKTSEMQHPLQTCYIQLSSISKAQIHPFTAAAPPNATSGPVFLFQTSPPKKKDAATDKEWTWRLAAMVNDAPGNKPLALEVSDFASRNGLKISAN